MINGESSDFPSSNLLISDTGGGKGGILRASWLGIRMRGRLECARATIVKLPTMAGDGLDSIDAISLRRTDTFISLRYQKVFDGRR